MRTSVPRRPQLPFLFIIFRWVSQSCINTIYFLPSYWRRKKPLLLITSLSGKQELKNSFQSRLRFCGCMLWLMGSSGSDKHLKLCQKFGKTTSVPGKAFSRLGQTLFNKYPPHNDIRLFQLGFAILVKPVWNTCFVKEGESLEMFGFSHNRAKTVNICWSSQWNSGCCMISWVVPPQHNVPV